MQSRSEASAYNYSWTEGAPRASEIALRVTRPRVRMHRTIPPAPDRDVAHIQREGGEGTSMTRTLKGGLTFATSGIWRCWTTT